MPDVCVAASCSRTSADNVSTHVFPKSPRLRQIWTRFVQMRRKYWNGPTTASRLCSAHFKEDQFINLGMFKAKQASRLLLKKGAIPTIHANSMSADQQETSSESSDFLGGPSDLSSSQGRKSSVIRKREVARLLQDSEVGTGSSVYNQDKVFIVWKGMAELGASPEIKSSEIKQEADSVDVDNAKTGTDADDGSLCLKVSQDVPPETLAAIRREWKKEQESKMVPTRKSTRKTRNPTYGFRNETNEESCKSQDSVDGAAVVDVKQEAEDNPVLVVTCKDDMLLGSEPDSSVSELHESDENYSDTADCESSDDPTISDSSGISESSGEDACKDDSYDNGQNHEENNQDGNPICRKTRPYSHKIRPVPNDGLERRRPNKCTMCFKRYQSKEILQQHLKKHMDEGMLQCELCPAQYWRTDQLQRHMRTHTGEAPFICEVCDARFVDNGALTIHMRRHTGERPFKCPYCVRAFSHSSNLTRHVRTHTGERPYACGLCEKRFNQLSNLLTHSRTHSDVRPFACPLCPDKNFLDQANLDRHLRTHSVERNNVCLICNKGFRERNQLSKHLRTHGSAKKGIGDKLGQQVPFQCAVCGKSFSQGYLLNKHIRNVHELREPGRGKTPMQVLKNTPEKKTDSIDSMEVDEGLEDGNFTVITIVPRSLIAKGRTPGCAADSSTQSLTERGSANNSSSGRREQPHQCSFCEQVFAKAEDLRTHVEVHSGDRPFKCTMCSSMFIYSAELLQHVRVHTEEKPYQCLICTRLFATAKELNVHAVEHKEKQVYTCKICSEVFPAAGNLSIHMKVHNAPERFYECNICHERFTLPLNARQHMREKHSETKPHGCMVCDKRFTRAADVTRHMKVHTGERPYQCRICQKRFSTSGNLNQHMRKMHITE